MNIIVTRSLKYLYLSCGMNIMSTFSLKDLSCDVHINFEGHVVNSYDVHINFEVHVVNN